MVLRWFGRMGTCLGLVLSACGGNERAPFVDETHQTPGEGGGSSVDQPSDVTMTGGGTGGTANGGPLGDLDPNKVYLVGHLNNGASTAPLGLALVSDTSQYTLSVPSPLYPYVVGNTLLYLDTNIWQMVADYTGSEAPADLAIPKSPQANDAKSTSKCPPDSSVSGVIAGPEGQLVYMCTDGQLYQRNQVLEALGNFSFLALGHGDLALGMFDGILAVYHTKTGETHSVDGNPSVLPFAARATKKGFYVAWEADAFELIEVDATGKKTLIKQYDPPPDAVTVNGSGAKLDAQGNFFTRATPANDPNEIRIYEFPANDEKPSMVYSSTADGQTLLLSKDDEETPLFTGP